MRLPNWELRFHDFLLSRQHTPFAYGSQDCCLFAADGVLAMTGIDIAAQFRDRYTTQLGAARVIRRVTGEASVAAAVAHAARFLREEPIYLRAARGDLVLVEEQGEPIAGLIHLDGCSVVVAGPTGLLRKDITEIRKVWHI